MVLSGEGADEVFGGYLYFHKAPDAKAFHEETLRKISKLYLYDCLRANKSLCAWGVEGRVPFLDKEFLDVAMRLNPAAKMCPGKTVEKKILREAFCRYAARRDRLASERAVLRRRWLQLDRYIEKDHFRTDHRRRDETSRRPFSDQYAAKQGKNIITVRSLKSTSRVRVPHAAYHPSRALPARQPKHWPGMLPSGI